MNTDETIMQSQEIEKHYPGSYYDVTGLERWLTEQAKQGLRLERQVDPAKSLLFRQDAPARVRFLLVPDIKKKDKRTYEDLRDLYADRGWNFICRFLGQVIIYETEDLWAAKPALPLTEEDYRRKWRGLVANMVAWLVLVALMIALVVWRLLGESVTYYDRITVWPWVFLLSTLLPMLMCFLDILEIYDLYAWWKHYRQQEEVKQWRAIPALRWTKFFGSWVMVAVTLAVPFLELVMENTNHRTLKPEEADVPIVTLELLGEEYEAQSVSVYEKSHLLLPDEMGVYSSCEGDGRNWHYLEFNYYRLRGEKMAYRLAEDEAAEKIPWGYEAAAPVETDSGFDAVWFCDGGDGFQYLTACAGDVAVTVEQSSDGDLLACLPELYEIVADYRAEH